MTTACDVRDPVAVKESLQSVVERSSVPDIVINNAAGNFISPTERLSPNAFSSVIDIVLKERQKKIKMQLFNYFIIFTKLSSIFDLV